MKKLSIIVAALAAVLCLALYEFQRAGELASEMQRLKGQNAALSAQLEQWKGDQVKPERRDEVSERRTEPSADVSSELLRLRGEVGVLRQQLAAVNATPQPPINQIPFLEPYLTRDAWSDHGTDKPLNTLITLFWALRQGDDDKLDKLISPSHSRQTPDSLKSAKEERDRITAFQMVNVSTVSQGDGKQFANVEAIIEKSPHTIGKTKDLNTVRWTLAKENGQWLIQFWQP